MANFAGKSFDAADDDVAGGIANLTSIESHYKLSPKGKVKHEFTIIPDHDVKPKRGS